jgi:hypothetical protein
MVFLPRSPGSPGLGGLSSKDQTATRINALEDHLQREHNDLLVALQQAAAATGVTWID